MDSVKRLARVLKPRNPRSGATYGIWIAQEVSDPNLSQVLLPGGGLDGSDVNLRFVPKGAHVTGLVANSTVLMTGSPLCIIARVVGDITTAVA